MGEVQPWNKRILQFQASKLAPKEQSERHYLEVHSAWARRELRATDGMLAYHTNLMLGQWDVLGGFGQAPDLWRLATMRTRHDAKVGFPPELLPVLSADHQNFLRELRGFEVEESVCFDRRAGQMTSDKYVLIFDRPVSVDRADAEAAVVEVGHRLSGLLAGAYGARLMVNNRVLSEFEYDDMREPGQRITSRRKPGSERMAYVEIYFDHQEWGEEFFASDDVGGLMVAAGFGPDDVAGYHALERAGLDVR
ncbi:hypothetical protein FXB39_05030 [Nocardioides sp. BGMRC 2183]|nr:hypothetical protein FXB39_05030 [Nocardioides sp. BGMRC 2183]